MNYEFSDLSQRVANMIHRAKVVEVDTATARIRVEYAGNTSVWIPWLTEKAGTVRHWNPPEVGESVLVLCPQGSTQQAVALTALYKTDYPAPSQDPNEHFTLYADGAKVGYNDKTHRLYAQLPDGSTTEILSTGGITLTGNVTINGSLHLTESLTANGNISDSQSSLQANRDVFNNHTHQGDSGGVTGKPNQQQ